MEDSATKEQFRLKFYLNAVSDALEVTLRCLERNSESLPITISFWLHFISVADKLLHKCNYAIDTIQEDLDEYTRQHTGPTDAEPPDS